MVTGNLVYSFNKLVAIIIIKKVDWATATALISQSTITMLSKCSLRPLYKISKFVCVCVHIYM